jgi:hypothetical protein
MDARASASVLRRSSFSLIAARVNAEIMANGTDARTSSASVFGTFTVVRLELSFLMDHMFMVLYNKVYRSPAREVLGCPPLQSG